MIDKGSMLFRVKWLVVMGLGALLLAGCGAESETEDEGQRARFGFVVLYCGYGATSKAQLRGCITHVDAERMLEVGLGLRGEPTPAAEFAVGKRSCDYASGPFCERAEWIIREEGYLP